MRAIHRKWAHFPGIFAFVLVVSSSMAALAQEESVKPGVNDAFKDPDVSEWVKKFEGESREVYLKRKEIVAACGLEMGMAVADVGAGTGLFTRLFAEAVGKEGKVFAIDISPKFLEHIDTSAKQFGLTNVQTILGTDHSLELAANSVDVVFICDTYHHFEYPARMMRSIDTSLNEGGRVVLIDFHRIPEKSSQWVLSHVRAGQEVFEKEITELGFQKTSEAHDLLHENYFVVFQKGAKDGGRAGEDAQP